MSSPISPGVYSKIIDLSNYVAAVPSTIGCLMGLNEKGIDNQFTFVGSISDYISCWGEPNITAYGKNYGQAPYEAYNFLGESGALYYMRCLPSDAAYANLKIDAVLASGDATASIIVSYVDSANTMAELQTGLASANNTFPLAVLYPIGRGVYYNAISVRFTPHSNPMISGVYVLDIYEKQSDGNEVIIESFEVSFDPNAMDSSGDSIWIDYILRMYSSVLRCQMILGNEDYTSGYYLISKIYDKEIGNVSVNMTALTASLTDDKQVFTDWQTSLQSGNATYMAIVKDGKGNEIYGWLGLATTTDYESVNVFSGRNLTTASRGWCGAVATFDPTSALSYQIKKSHTSVGDAFISSTPVPLKKGSDGSLLDASGDLSTAVATQVLAEGYAGTLTNPITGNIEDTITDTDAVYFTMVFDAGYPSDVKEQISTLVQTRRDCVAILDNLDNSSFNAAVTNRQNTNTYNNYFTAIYEGYSKVYDIFTGQDMWVSPVYHMSYILPRNDNVAEIWYAAAGWTRGVIDSIKELRYNPKLGQRDQGYLMQLNPLVKFIGAGGGASGYVVWGQLTSQSKPSALQDLNIVRLVLYCQKAISNFSAYYIFEQNDAITWSKFNNEVLLFLNDVKRRRGLDSFSSKTYATDYMKKTKTFACDIQLTPTRTTEKISLSFFIT